MSDVDERDLTESLHRAAAGATVPVDGLRRVRDRAHIRARRRRARDTVAISLAVVGIVIVTARLVGNSDVDVAATARPWPDAQGLPRLIVDDETLPPGSIRYFDESLEGESRNRSTTYLQVARSSAKWDAPMVVVMTTDEPAMTVGEQSPVGMTERHELHGATAYLVDDGVHPATLGWRSAAGVATRIVAVGLDHTELLGFGRALTARADGMGWDLPADSALEMWFDDEIPAGAQLPAYQAAFGAGADVAPRDAPVSLTVRASDAARFAALIADRLGLATAVSHATVRGSSALVIRDEEGGASILWWEPDWTADVELRLDGGSSPRLAELLDRIVELDSEDWNRAWPEGPTPLTDRTGATR